MTPEPVASRDLSPSSFLPSAYYALAHACLFIVSCTLAFNPSIAGGSFYQPRIAALTHLVTLGWITGSILGSLYVVAPLALGIPMKVSVKDWIGYASFSIGTVALAGSAWIGRYDAVAASGILITVPIAWAATRVVRGFRRSPAPGGVTLHVAFAFVNILGAGALGILVALDRSRGFLGLSPVAVTFAHAHIAAVGWATMLVVGLAYRLIPMMLPSAMPTGGRLAISAVLLECGLVGLVVALLGDGTWTPVPTALVAAGLISFAMQMRRSVARRRPRPPALPPRDWSTWQAHAALLWLASALVAGGALSIGVGAEARLPVMWAYGFAGLLGFLGQIIAGIQGRLVPMYAWYRAFALLGHPPPRSANSLPSAAFARAIFVAWTVGLLPLCAGLSFEFPLLIRAGATSLMAAVLLGSAYLTHMMRAAVRV